MDWSPIIAVGGALLGAAAGAAGTLVVQTRLNRQARRERLRDGVADKTLTAHIEMLDCLLAMPRLGHEWQRALVIDAWLLPDQVNQLLAFAIRLRDWVERYRRTIPTYYAYGGHRFHDFTDFRHRELSEVLVAIAGLIDQMKHHSELSEAEIDEQNKRVEGVVHELDSLDRARLAFIAEIAARIREFSLEQG